MRICIFKKAIDQNFLKFYKIFCYFTLFLIGIGAFVRVMDAGLACPDWPLCFGQWIPSYDPKVYLEVFHRFIAGIFAFLAVLLHIPLLRTKEKKLVSGRMKVFCWISFFLILLQVFMGALTVWFKLHAHIVTTHLFLGLLLFSLYFWIYWNLENNFYFLMKKTPLTQRKMNLLKTEKWSKGVQYFIYFIFFVLCLQILLGSQVASQYAGLACPDFPLCHGRWFPTFKGLIGLQVQHRIGAYGLVFFVLILVFFAYKNSYQKLQKFSLMLLSMVAFQMILGALNIWLKLPPLISVLHLVLAALILRGVLRMMFEICVEKRSLSLLTEKSI